MDFQAMFRQLKYWFAPDFFEIHARNHIWNSLQDYGKVTYTNTHKHIRTQKQLENKVSDSMINITRTENSRNYQK